MAEDVKRIDQVKAMIEEGIYTKAEIAEQLGIKPGGVSSQMTYLRWMGNFIATDPETKCLSFVTEEEFAALEAEKKANAKSSSAASKKTPEEQAAATAKTIATQEKQLENWSKKLAEYQADEGTEDAPEDIEDLIAEAQANVTLLAIKLKRNRAKAAELPEPPAPAEAPADENDDKAPAEDDNVEDAGTEDDPEGGDLL